MLGLSVLCMPLAGADKKSLTKEQSAKVIEAAIRKAAKKPTGELTKADLEKVTELNLNRSQLTGVKGMEKLTKLEWLHLGNNQLTNVPMGLEKLTQLKVLYLYTNQLAKMPKGLEKLTQLKVLNLGDNQLTEVKGLENLTELTYLNLYGNQLTKLPKDLEKLTQLEDLDLQLNPNLTKAQIAELQKALPNCKISSSPTK